MEASFDLSLLDKQDMFTNLEVFLMMQFWKSAHVTAALSSEAPLS